MLDLISMFVSGHTRTWLLRAACGGAVLACTLGVVTCTEALEKKLFSDKQPESEEQAKAGSLR